jgi:hypothetical protein
MKFLATLNKGIELERVKHYIGAPPELTQGEDTRRQLGAAHFLVIDENSDGVFLLRYGNGGEYVGDTWHINIDDAKHQASYEFGDRVRDWTSVPPEVGDVVEFGRSQVVK